MSECIEFDARYPGNKRWEEALDMIDQGIWEVSGDYSYGDNDTEVYYITGEEAEDFCDMFDLTDTSNFQYRIWKAKGKSAEISKLKKEAIVELNKKLQRQEREIIRFLAEVKPIWKPEVASKTESIIKRFFDEYKEMEIDTEKA